MDPTFSKTHIVLQKSQPLVQHIVDGNSSRAAHKLDTAHTRMGLLREKHPIVFLIIIIIIAHPAGIPSPAGNQAEQLGGSLAYKNDVRFFSTSAVSDRGVVTAGLEGNKKNNLVLKQPQ
ncbi:hypothetical protein BDR07DRAFT_1477526 [Suillus spraguei]|nr:hypothetical protein BDR07DRAFT_1498766 [Suillus spraguei]KAG2368919.1 hypothetical protein BDR07DRAFT_1477526 [Suillus spraguei]